MLKVVTSACLASVALLAAAATAGAASVPTNRNSADRAPYVTKGGPSRGSDTSAFSADAKHDGSSGHLPGSSFLARRTKTLVLALVPVASRAEAGTTANGNICVRGWHYCFWTRLSRKAAERGANDGGGRGRAKSAPFRRAVPSRGPERTRRAGLSHGRTRHWNSEWFVRQPPWKAEVFGRRAAAELQVVSDASVGAAVDTRRVRVPRRALHSDRATANVGLWAKIGLRAKR